ncbi:tubulin delta chain-like [Neodiprion fabricii]|uniref:tubulin delta chain-like n=1 Tax=Neodiprion fabricii TaxID=2872261 RepID=UPI001ED90701|nr:tubulin delta chain-like [Neodiprion fabricii]
MLTLQFGQCGNQVGHTLFSTVAQDLYSANTGVPSKRNSDYVQAGFDTWFKELSKNGKHLARAILVDTEQKVVNTVCSSNESNSMWNYSPANIVCCAGGGSANNWGYGHYIKGPQLSSAALEAVRHEVERADTFQGFLAILSSAGGTGSGVGSYLMEKIRDEYPTKTMASSIVFPYGSGEVCTQNYNTLLTLAKFIDITDVAILFENDQIHGICENLTKVPNTNFNDLNHVIGQKLAAVLQPVLGTTNILSTLVHRLTPHPQYKIATIKTSLLALPSCQLYDGNYKWNSIVWHLKQMLRAPALNLNLADMETKMPSNSIPSRTDFAYSKSVSNILITRGSSIGNDTIVPVELNDEKLYADWVPHVEKIAHLHQPRKLLGKDKIAALVANNSQLHRPIDAIVDKAWNTYIHSAFLHQYKQHGVEEDDFLQAFAKIENIVKVYRELCSEEIIS